MTQLLRPAFRICFSEGPRQSRETLRKLPARPQQHARDGPHQMHPQTSSQNPWASSSDPTRAIQNMVHPSGASPGLGEQPRAARGAALYYRRQSLDASLPPRPPPADHPAGLGGGWEKKINNLLQDSRLKQAREEKKKKKKSMSDFSGLPGRCGVCRSREDFQHLPAARMGQMLGGGSLGWVANVVPTNPVSAILEPQMHLLAAGTGGPE